MAKEISRKQYNNAARKLPKLHEKLKKLTPGTDAYITAEKEIGKYTKLMDEYIHQERSKK